MGASVAIASQAVNKPVWKNHVPAFHLSEDDQRGIISVLSNPNAAPGTRAGLLLRKFPSLKFSPRAKLLYVLLSGFIGVDPKRPDSVVVTMKTLAAWLNCSTRTVQSVVRELTRSGPLPLLLEVPGRPGRASEYRVVRDPFAIAERQADDAERTRRHRHPAVVRAQAAAFGAGIDMAAASRKRDYLVATRSRVALDASLSPR